MRASQNVTVKWKLFLIPVEALVKEVRGCGQRFLSCQEGDLLKEPDLQVVGPPALGRSDNDGFGSVLDGSVPKLHTGFENCYR